MARLVGSTQLTYSRTNNGNFDLFDDDTRIDEKRLNTSITEASDFLVDIREYDVPYHVRVMIDKGMFSLALNMVTLLTWYFRHPSWKMVLCRGKAWRHDGGVQ